MLLSAARDIDILRLHYNKNKCPSELESRVLPYIDLTYCIKGQLQYWYNGEPITLHPGDAILFPPGTTRRRAASDTPCTYASFNLFPSREVEPEVSGYLPKCATPKVVFMLENFYADFDSIAYRKNEKCAAIFFYLYNQLLEDSIYTDTPHIQAIKRYINDNLYKELRLQQIANHIHLAPEYVCALFKKHTGQTISKYVIQQRIEQAKLRIGMEKVPMTKIAEECGFRDYCYFSTTFKKLTGLSPVQYQSSLFSNHNK